MTIKGLIFDYGGVLWDMRWDVTRVLEQEHGLAERVLVETLYASDTWRKVEVGIGDREAWLAEAHNDLETKTGRSLPQLHAHWRDQQRIIGPTIDLIGRLRPPYKTAVLSNADNTLISRLRDTLGIDHLFDDIVCSADVGLAKPDSRIYALSARRLGLSAAECVFVDDMERNVEAARAAGMHAIHFRHELGHSLEEQFAELGVRPTA